ncbi:hypothetical protein Tco_0137368, partial [Tanacetum coccineum]
KYDELQSEFGDQEAALVAHKLAVKKLDSSPLHQTKHIEIRHHFIRDCYEKKLINVEKIHTDLNVADLLTKPFDGPRFNYLVVGIVRFNSGSVRFNPGSSVKVRFNSGSSKLKLILVLLRVEKGDARSTWTWKRKCQLSLANWMHFGCK